MSCATEVLSTKAALLDHLFAVIKPLAPGYADKIVGMLAESSELHLMTILGSEPLLRETVDKALDCIKSHEAINCDDSLDEEKVKLGDELFSIVAETEPALCAQITGMLLELDVGSLRSLLMNRDDLLIAIGKAKWEYEKQLQQQSGHQSVLPDELAERLYEAVAEVYDKNAPKITGMLAELSADDVNLILNCPGKFKHMIQLCREALEETDQWIAQ